MDNRRMDAALREAGDTRTVIITPGALRFLDDVLSRWFDDRHAVIVADEITFAVAGQSVHDRLRAIGRAVEEPIIFPGTPMLYADFPNVMTVEGALRRHDALPVAVGSGTINDITKLAAYRVGRPYLCIPTAASMDGYAAFGAAITKDGFKQTMSCPAPRAIVADLDILVRAPSQMNATGYGDLLGKVTAGADWILADAVGSERIDPSAWSLVQDSLRDWTAHPEQLSARDPVAISHLFEGLIMAGVAMQVHQSSRPASGSEHRFSHLWEMQALDHRDSPVPHGFKVGVGTLAAAALYEEVLGCDLHDLDIDALCRAWPSRSEVEHTVRQVHAVPQIAENAVVETLAKYIDAHQLRQRLVQLREHWQSICGRLEVQLMTAKCLRDLLRSAGCPIHPQEIGVSTAGLRQSYDLARTIRRRYTVLDLVYETGLLSSCADRLFGPGGFWSGADSMGRLSLVVEQEQVTTPSD